MDSDPLAADFCSTKFLVSFYNLMCSTGDKSHGWNNMQQQNSCKEGHLTKAKGEDTWQIVLEVRPA